MVIVRRPLAPHHPARSLTLRTIAVDHLPRGPRYLSPSDLQPPFQQPTAAGRSLSALARRDEWRLWQPDLLFLSTGSLLSDHAVCLGPRARRAGLFPLILQHLFGLDPLGADGLSLASGMEWPPDGSAVSPPLHGAALPFSGGSLRALLVCRVLVVRLDASHPLLSSTDRHGRARGYPGPGAEPGAAHRH